jgi:hypothetical protein
MVAPGVLAGWTLRPGFRGNGIPLRDDSARDAPFTATTGLTTAHINGREADVGRIIVHSTLFMAVRDATRKPQTKCRPEPSNTPGRLKRNAELQL